jgi:hypothetical protein
MQCVRIFGPVSNLRKISFFVLLSLTLALGNSILALASDDETAARASFVDFEKEWLKKVNVNGEYGQQNVKVEPDEQGRYCARYRIIAPGEGSEVKPTGVKASPFVGVLHYEEQTFASHADTPEQAKQGPFENEKGVLFTEIFRYSNGKWVF